MNGRYFLMPMLDGWTTVFQAPGKRTTGTGAQTYAITGPDGAELSDRWQDALRLKDMIRALWQRIAEEDAHPR